jgi:hypothetical protein
VTWTKSSRGDKPANELFSPESEYGKLGTGGDWMTESYMQYDVVVRCCEIEESAAGVVFERGFEWSKSPVEIPSSDMNSICHKPAGTSIDLQGRQVPLNSLLLYPQHSSFLFCEGSISDLKPGADKWRRKKRRRRRLAVARTSDSWFRMIQSQAYNLSLA